MRLRTFLAVVRAALVGDRNRSGQKFGMAGIDHARAPPDAREIGFAVVSARCRTGRWLMQFHVGDLVRTILAQGIKLRGVAQSDIERCDFRRLHHHPLLLERGEGRRGGADIVRARRQVSQRVFAVCRGHGFENGPGLGVFRLHGVVVDGVADGIDKGARDGAGGRRRLRDGRPRKNNCKADRFFHFRFLVDRTRRYVSGIRLFE